MTLRFAFRTLCKAPAFSLTIVLTLAIGIAATAVMFSVVSGVLLTPLPYPQQGRLVEIVHSAPTLGIEELHASPAIYFGYRERSAAFESIGLWDWDESPVTVSAPGEPEAVASLQVTHEVLLLLGAQALVGRMFVAGDDLPGAEPTVVLSYGFWQRRFGGADVLGRTLLVAGDARQVIGVLPPSFEFFAQPAEIYYPLQPDRATAVFPSFDGRAVARLEEGVTIAEANADVARLLPILAEEFPVPAPQLEGLELRPALRPLSESVVADLSGTLWTLMGAIGLLLAIACTNVANLVLLRAEKRRHEMAIRNALGAVTRHVVRLAAWEGVLLASAAALCGLAGAYLMLPALLSVVDADLPAIMTVSLDYRVVAVTVGITVVAALLIVLISLARARSSGALHLGAGAPSEVRHVGRTRDVLVVSQVAIALLLLVGSGLMLRSFFAIKSVDPGFRDAEEVQTFQLTLPAADAADPERSTRTLHAIADRISAIPGTDGAAFAAFGDALPLDGDGRSGPIAVDPENRARDAEVMVEIQLVSPGFVETLGTAVLAGRSIEWNDVYDARPVVVVSENLARTLWGSADGALGRRLRSTWDDRWSEVVGVVRDVHHDGLDRPASRSAIFPLRTDEVGGGARTVSFVARNERAGTANFVDALQRAVREVRGDLALGNVSTLGELYQRSTARTSITLILLVTMSSIALLLGIVGIYGVVSYAVSQRVREIGIRLALGAAERSVRLMFVSRALVLTAIGVALGAVAAFGLARLIASQLFGVGPVDPLAYSAAVLTVVIATLLASYLPARRAARIAPIEVLRAE